MYAQVSSRRLDRTFVALVAAFALLAGLAFARALPAAAAVELPEGTELHAVLTSSDVNTKNAQPGDPVTFSVVEPYPNGRTAFSGATIHGHVADVTKAGQGKKAAMRIGFDSIMLRDGEHGPVSGEVVALKTVSENTVARKAVGAGAGMAVGSQTIGRILGGTLGGVVGTLGGAAAGYAYANNDKANFSIVKDAPATIRITQSTELRQAR